MKIKKPRSCFITFKYEKGKLQFKNKFQNNNKDLNYLEYIFDKNKINEAEEPSDIKWEHFQITDGEMLLNKTKVSI